MKKKQPLVRVRKGEEGFTLLEYVAGATVIAGVVWMAVSAMGGNLGAFFDRLGQWATERSESIDVGGNGG